MTTCIHGIKLNANCPKCEEWAKEENKKEPQSSWSPADEEWLTKSVPAEFHSIARRWGKVLFVMAFNANVAHEGLATLLRRCRGNRELEPCVHAIGNSMNEFVGNWCSASGTPPKDFLECRADIDRAVQIAQAAGDKRRSPGGIILNG